MRIPALLIIASVAVLAACQTNPKANKPGPDDRYFVENVKPVLERNCLRCHTGPAAPAGLNLGSREAALTARKNGRPFIIPRKPDASLLVIAISRNGTHPKLMPRLTMSLTDDQIGALREWIEDGAMWPAGPQGKLSAVPNPENP